MAPDDSLRLHDEFPPPSLETWHQQVRKDLRGKDYADVAWHVDDGDPLEPLATRADLAHLPHCDPAVSSWLGSAGRWRSRELVVSADPDACASQIRSAIGDEIDEIEVCYDDLCRDGLEPSTEDLPGLSGAAIHDLDALRRALTEIDLGTTHVGLSAGEGAVAALAQLLVLADERGVARRDLRGDVDFDPIARLTQRQAGFDPEDEDTVVSSHTSIGHVFDEAAALMRACARDCPGIRPISLDAQGFHLCGASPELELAAATALVIDVARHLAERDVPFDDIARGSTWRVQVAHDLLAETAKLRAMRLLWLKVAEGFGATDAGRRPLIHAITSGRSRSYRYDNRTNLLRTMLSATTAVLGGCDSIAIIPFDEDPACQDAAMQRLARHQHALLRHESHLGTVRDPLAGSFAIERLTDRLARRAWSHVQTIEGHGGLCESMRSGALFEMVLPSAEARTREFATRARTLVGINRYQDPRLEGEPSQPVVSDADLERIRTDHLERLRARDGDAVRSILATPVDLANACEAARAGATTGEIARANWPDDEYRHRFPPIAQFDGDEFEELRERREEAPARALIACFGDDVAARKRATFAASVLQLGGYDVSDPTDFESLEACHDAVGAARPHVVVLAGDERMVHDCIDRIADHGSFIAIAGPPDQALEARGVVSFFDGMDIVATLTSIGAFHE